MADMVELTIDGIKVRAPKGTTVLEAAREMGIVIPTLCYYPGLTPYGACRLCIVELIRGKRSSLDASCTLPVSDGMVVFTNSERVKKVRKVILELLLSTCPNSKVLQDMAANMGVTKVRFKIKDRGCILCGLCVRYCKEQMQSGGIGFVGRGTSRKVGTPFEMTPAECRNCNGCEWICPVCMRACRAGQLVEGICGGCLNVAVVETCPVCVKCSESVGPEGHRAYGK
ncbi:MAG: 2Fe-2S iron-sulfur cluster-binding protein [Planctomycetota bacterium]|nr:2Fe-2S iron-sulfur cluster-binding protein [Planctomycetota bacterium]